MSDDANNGIYSRRGFLGLGSAALAATGLVSATDAASQEQRPYPTKSDRSASAPGPTNPPLDTQNPDSNLPPPPTRAAYRRLSIPSRSLTNECKKVDGRARPRFASSPFPKQSPAWT